MKNTAPPRWLERGLLSLLPVRDRETVSGDLFEVYAEDKLPRHGKFRANAWYARQVVSFAPRALLSLPNRRRALAMLCGLTALSGAWLGTMDVLLKHRNLLAHEAISVTIVLEALLTLAGLRASSARLLRPLAIGGDFAILWLAGKAFLGVLRDSHMEGYVVLIALALAVQAVLTWHIFARRPVPPQPLR